MSFRDRLKPLWSNDLDDVLAKLPDDANEDIVDTVLANYYEKLDNSESTDDNKRGINFNFRRNL